jgi:hypothetical protein
MHDHMKLIFTISLCIYLHLRYKVYSYPVKQTESYSTKRKEKQKKTVDSLHK